MAIAVHIAPDKMTKADYEKVMADLDRDGAAEPEGRLFHAGYGNEHVRMFDVWDSRESFDPYHDRLMTALQGAGIDGGIVEVSALHSDVPD